MTWGICTRSSEWKVLIEGTVGIEKAICFLPWVEAN